MTSDARELSFGMLIPRPCLLSVQTWTCIYFKLLPGVDELTFVCSIQSTICTNSTMVVCVCCDVQRLFFLRNWRQIAYVWHARYCFFFQHQLHCSQYMLVDDCSHVNPYAAGWWFRQYKIIKKRPEQYVATVGYISTHLKVLCYLMNTSMTGFRWY